MKNIFLGNILTPELLSAQLAVAQQGAQYNQFLNPYLSLFPSGGLNAYTGKIEFSGQPPSGEPQPGWANPLSTETPLIFWF